MSWTEASFTTPTSTMFSPLLFSRWYSKSIGLPSVPFVIIFFSSVIAGLNLSMKPTVRIFPALSASLIRSCASFTVLVIGFSTNVWTPALRVLLATAKWVEAGVQIVTPSGLSFSSISSTLV